MRLTDLLDVAADARDASDPRLPELLRQLGDAGATLDVLRLPCRLELPSGAYTFDSTSTGFAVGVDADGARFVVKHGYWVDENMNAAWPGCLHPGGYFERYPDVRALTFEPDSNSEPWRFRTTTRSISEFGNPLVVSSEFGAGALNDPDS